MSHRDYKDAVVFCLGCQAILGIFASLLLDGGQCLQYFAVAMLAFWCSAALLIYRTQAMPRRIDVLYVKYGFLIVLPATVSAMHFAWSLRGVKL